MPLLLCMVWGMDMTMDLRVAGIVKESVVDGPGFRYVIFAQGCVHKCKGCHNPQTHSFDGGYVCNADDILREIKASYMLDGITCSGGECFESAEGFAYIARKVREMGLNVWTYTGYTYEYIIEHMKERKGWKELLYNTDVLIDGKYEEELKDISLAYRGSGNQRIIDVRESLKCGGIVVLEMDKKVQYDMRKYA